MPNFAPLLFGQAAHSQANVTPAARCAGSCFREIFALQRHEFLTEQGKKLPEAAERIHFSLK